MAGAAMMMFVSPAASLDFKPAETGKAFEKAAKAMGAKKFKAIRQTCSTGENYVCRYALTGGLALIGSAPAEQEPVDALGLYFGKDSESLIFFVGVGALIGMVEPDVSDSERQRIAKKLVEGALNGGAAELDADFKWSMTSEYDESVGVRILVDVR